MADIGSLVVKLAAETADFREDLGKSARLLEKHADGMRSSLERVAEVAKTTFAIAVGVESVGALKELPFLKDLAANQDLNIRMTQAEIESAEQASKALGRMKAEHNFVAQTIVTAALPAMEELVGQLKEVVLGTHNSAEAMVRLRDDGTLKEWAQDAAVGLAIVIDAMRGLIQMVKSVIGSFDAVWADMELLGTFIAGGKGLNPFSEENQATLKAALEKRNAIVEKANQNYVDLWKMPLLSDAVKSRFDAINKGEAEATGGAKPKLNYNSATGALTAGAMAQIESDIKKLQGLTDVESGILKDRQKIIDLYESQGYISFKEASEARLNAQQDFTDKLGDLYGQEETILKRGLATVAKTTQDKLKLQDKLSEITLRREKLERDAQQSNLEREIKLPGETLKDIQEQVARSQNQLRATEEQIKVLKDSGAISEVESLKRLSAARKSSADELADFAAKARELVEAAPGNDKLADSFKRIEEAARQAADGAQLLGQRAFELADPGAGFSKALRTLGEETEQVGKQMEAVTTRAFNGMTDALTNFVMTGKLDFRTLATSIISDLIRIQIQRSITLPMANALGGMFGFANGGVMTSAGPLPLTAPTMPS